MNLVIKIHSGCIYFCYRSGFDFLYAFSIIPIFRILPITKKKFNYLFVSFCPDFISDFRNLFGEVKSRSFKHNLPIVEIGKV